jgi:hypothetical protein
VSAEDPVRDRLVRSVRTVEPDVDAAFDRVSRRGRRRGRLAVAARVTVVAGFVALVVVAGPALLDLVRSPSHPIGGGASGPYSVIAGSYRATIVSRPGVIADAGMAGAWTLRLDPDGDLELTAPPGFAAETSGITFRLVGEEFRTNAFPNDLCPARMPGTYHWSIVGGQLRFTVVEDPCEARTILFADQIWNQE